MIFLHSNLRGDRAVQFWTPYLGTAILTQTVFDFSTRRVTRQDLVREIGRHSAISTRSPSLKSPVSTWAWYFFERVMILPIRASRTRRSTRTTTVFCILALTTRPTSLRWFLAGACSGAATAFIWPPFLS